MVSLDYRIYNGKYQKVLKSVATKIITINVNKRVSFSYGHVLKIHFSPTTHVNLKASDICLTF